jgi:hypothetical protein
VLDGVVVGRASALVYDDEFAFCGLYIVEKPYRGQGYGLALTKARLEYIGDRNAGLDGVVNMTDRYARLGYRPAHLSKRYVYKPTARAEHSAHVAPVADVSFEELLQYDARHFPARREGFLKCWITQPDAAALGFVENGTLKGYGVARKCRAGHKIGPLFADEPEIAIDLFHALSNHGLNGPVYLDIPEPNAAAMKLPVRYSMEYVFECARMYLRYDPGLPLQNIYGITTFEAG